MVKSYSNLSKEERVRVREILLKMDSNKKKLLEIFNEVLINPLKRQREMVKEFLQNKISLERLISHNISVNKLIKEFTKL